MIMVFCVTLEIPESDVNDGWASFQKDSQPFAVFGGDNKRICGSLVYFEQLQEVQKRAE